MKVPLRVRRQIPPLFDEHQGTGQHFGGFHVLRCQRPRLFSRSQQLQRPRLSLFDQVFVIFNEYNIPNT